MHVAIIGGGAAGFFSAITVKENYPQAEVVIFEKTKNILSKVKVSGGGRCNVTNACNNITELIKAYPRGGKSLKKAFHTFNTKHTIKWFESRGVPLVTQDDGCIFPASQDAQSIIDCFISETKKYEIKVIKEAPVIALEAINDQLVVYFDNDALPAKAFDKVIVATGGSPKRSGLEWLERFGHAIKPPVPSLFTFNIPHDSITQLMGIVVENTLVNIQGTSLKADGPLLITHWGMSGPAILKLSAYGALALNAMHYNFKLKVNWVNIQNSEYVTDSLNEIIEYHENKQLVNIRPFDLPGRLWNYLLNKSAITADKKWSELGKKGINKLTNILTNDIYEVKGKSTFRDEFVTCGGVGLESINMNSMQSKLHKNLYFAGEVLDIDAITGGFNFQAAWTTGFIAAQLSD